MRGVLIPFLTEVKNEYGRRKIVTSEGNERTEVLVNSRKSGLDSMEMSISITYAVGPWDGGRHAVSKLKETHSA